MSPSFNGTREFTEAPVEPGRFSSPEFLDIDGVRGYFGLKQSLTYRLLAEDKIRAVSIRQRGKTRGRRLFDVDSIRRFLNSQVDKQGGACGEIVLNTNLKAKKEDSARPGKGSGVHERKGAAK
jgi:hypothetical protein